MTMDLFNQATSSAVVIGPYRYSLKRRIGAAGLKALAIMVNPSTADAWEDDHTIRKLMGFADRLGWGQVAVGNLFAWRATHVKELATAPDPVGPDNDTHLTALIQEADVILVAWGAVAKVPPSLRGRWREVVALADQAAKPRLFCLGRCGDGHPRHPLMLGYDSFLTVWDRDHLAGV